MHALVVGGTGPTGHHIIKGLLDRGYRVTMLHSGKHEIPEIPQEVEHIHADAYAADSFKSAIDSRTFDLCVSNYGRLRMIAEITAGCVGRFISIGGIPAYRGYMNPALFKPAGLPVPISEGDPLVTLEKEDEKGWRIVRTEEAVFRYHEAATHFRYPYVYGPYQLVPREWCIVRRIIDRRPHIIIPDDGLSLYTYGFGENLAHAVLLAVDKPEIASGKIYNCGDEVVLTLRQVVEIVTEALAYNWEIISMPWHLAIPARPLMMQPLPTHRVLSIAKIQYELGYHDVVKPAEAVAFTARWFKEHPCERGGTEEMVLQDPFDYDAEDILIAEWKRLLKAMPEVAYKKESGYGMHYSGPGGRPRTKKTFE